MRVADLAPLRELGEWMRSIGAVHARVGELELTLAVLPIAPSTIDATPAAPVPPPPPEKPEDVERRDLETLLHSCGGDASPFVRATG